MTRENFETWASDRQRVLYNYILQYVSDSHDAKDILQESLLSIYQSTGTYRQESSFNTFALTIVKRRIADFYRSRKEVLEIEESLPAGDSFGMIDLKDGIRSLKPADRQLLFLIFEMGLNYKEISSLEGIPEGTVKSRFSAIRQKLRTQLEESHV